MLFALEVLVVFAAFVAVALSSPTHHKPFSIEPKFGVTISDYTPPHHDQHHHNGTENGYHSGPSHHWSDQPMLTMFSGPLCEGSNITIGLGNYATDECCYPNYNYLSAVVTYGQNSTWLPYNVDIISNCSYGNTIRKSFHCFSFNDTSDPYNTYATVPKAPPPKKKPSSRDIDRFGDL